jgi:four helix bundle protein
VKAIGHLSFVGKYEYIYKYCNEDCKHFRDLEVYQGAMEIVMSVSELTKKFPADEKYVLNDQIRRSSRSICANLAEAWRKRRYLGAVISKLNDAETEAAETQVHLEIAFRHRYLSAETLRDSMTLVTRSSDKSSK